MILSKYVFVKIASSNVNYWKSLGYEVKSAGGRGGKNNGQRIKVKVGDLKPNSNVNVACRCDECPNKYIQRFSRNTDVCYDCRRSKTMTGNQYGSANRGKPGKKGAENTRFNPEKPIQNVKFICIGCNTPTEGRRKINPENQYRCRKCASSHRYHTNPKYENMHKAVPKGEDHYRWNPDLAEFKKYRNKVQWLTTQTYEANKDIINPDNHPRARNGVEGGYQLDHKVSVKEAFKNGWTPEQVADIQNLQLLPWRENRDKWH